MSNPAPPTKIPLKQSFSRCYRGGVGTWTPHVIKFLREKFPNFVIMRSSATFLLSRGPTDESQDSTFPKTSGSLIPSVPAAAANHLTPCDFNQLRAQLGSDIAIKAYREGKLPFPDGSIIVALHWKRVPSDEDNQVFGRVQAFVAGSPVIIHFMVKDSKKYAGGSETLGTAKLATRPCTKKC